MDIWWNAFGGLFSILGILFIIYAYKINSERTVNLIHNVIGGVLAGIIVTMFIALPGISYLGAKVLFVGLTLLIIGMVAAILSMKFK